MLIKISVAALMLAAGLLPAAPACARDSGAAVRRAVVPAKDIEDAYGRNVFQVLVGEFALLRGDSGLGSRAWSELATRTKDPKALERATEVAGFARQYDVALELARLWQAVEPDSEKARQVQSSLLVLTSRLEELAPQLSTLLEKEPGSVGDNLLQINRMLSRHADKKAVQKLVDRVSAPYGQLPEAHFAMAQAAANAGDDVRALAEIGQAQQLRPDWEAAALVRAQLQARTALPAAIGTLAGFVENHPAAADARLMLGRMLLADKRYPEAKVHFDRLIAENPERPEVIYPVAMLALQQGDTATGRKLLEKLLGTDFSDRPLVHFFLGQLDEEQEHPESALEHYAQVTAGDQMVAARSRSAQILAKQGRLGEAREVLRKPAVKGGDAVRLLIVEAQLLREAGHAGEALGLLENALGKQPDDADLLYESAMLADRLGKHELLERRLKHLLVLKPEHAHALNALGYSWADRNIHLVEAERLVAKAVQLAPEDPFIMDSLGWVQYRQGHLGEALMTLKRAYGIRNDPEIAAHLGEVLWKLDRRDEARQVLEEAAQRNPDNEVLAGVIKKLLP